MRKTLEVLENPETLIERAQTIILEQIEQGIQERGRFTLALAGGSTPKPLYQGLSQQNLPWEKIYIFWGDERYVPVEHPDSNEGMARNVWLNHVPIPPENIYGTPTQGENPSQDAQKYQTQLEQFFQQSSEEFPQFDIILLGIGDDGHTASLFPQTAALQVKDRWVTVGEKDGQPRITFTVPLINQARHVIFLVGGASKQNALEQIFAPIADPLQYPARLIQPQGKLWWLLDSKAGEHFPKKI